MPAIYPLLYRLSAFLVVIVIIWGGRELLLKNKTRSRSAKIGGTLGLLAVALLALYLIGTS